jgi:DNA-binding response OmpR family regulator
MSSNQTILVIDDEPAILVGLAAMMRRQGYLVITACNGQDGLRLAKTETPDLILSDVMMPPPNGFEVRRLLSQDSKLSTIPFVFLTARVGVEDRVSGIREGADDYITKPFQPEELVARIDAIFRRIETEQARGREQMKASAEEEMNELRHEILQNFHHELRTPLTNVIMPLQAAVSYKFEDPSEQIKFIRTALSNLERLESLITDFIILTNIDHGDLNTIRQVVDPDLYIVKPIQKRLERYKEKELLLVMDVQIDQEITAPRKEYTHAAMHLRGRFGNSRNRRRSRYFSNS